MRRRLLALLGLAGGAFASALLYRRRAGDRRARVDVYLDDGSMISFGEGSPEAERLLPVARDLLAAARR